MYFMRLLLLSFLSSCFFHSYAQVVSIDPPLATQNDTVTITFDAALGNGALFNIAPVYAHTGVITNLSPNPTSWRHVQGNWGTADPKVLMTFQGNNMHTIRYHINSYYNIPPGETVEQLAFVFRNTNGSVVGRAADGSDIFVPIYPPGFAAAITDPIEDFVIIDISDTLHVTANSTDSARIEIFHEGLTIALDSQIKELKVDIPIANYGPGKFFVTMAATDGVNTEFDTIYYIVPGPVQSQDPPAGTEHGINIIDSNTVILSFFAPGKDFLYALGDFSDWELDPEYYMKRSLDSSTFWVQLDSLDPHMEYRFQYQIEGVMRVAEIYAEKILDPWNDDDIDQDRYPDLIPYPSETTDPVSVFQIMEPEFQWDPGINYQRPNQEELVVYELLVRDFTLARDFKTVKDTLDYLEGLGINAIELMPFNEFEGNDSWGYNPSFYFAPDKYYGPKDSLKTLVEECHRRGIAVIMDMTLNHSFGQSPMVRMYFDPSAGPWGQPTAENPWFREVPAHPFNVGYDFDHESPHTETFVDRVLKHWVEEYRIDGFRMDLSKGFTNTFSGNNVGLWSAYDQSRINIWERIGDQIWAVDSTVYMILEHFAQNSEETVLSDMGFMLWGNCNHEYNEATMGYTSNLNCASYQDRGWNDPHLVAYMESHDEERLMYKNLEFGNSSGNYDITDLSTALKRVELASNFFLTIPGPKMIWQFGELGYDYSINTCEDGTTIDPNCRLAKKPIRWDYFEEGGRKRLYSVMAALNQLRNDHEVFHTDNFNLSLTSSLKSIQLDGANMDVQVIGNFNVDPFTMTVNFLHTGTWYEYWSGDSIDVQTTTQNIFLNPGDYRLYTDVKLQPPVLLSVDDISEDLQTSLSIYPNPAKDEVYVISEGVNGYSMLLIRDINGQLLFQKEILVEDSDIHLDLGSQSLQLPNGVYVISVVNDDVSLSGRLVISR